MIQYKEFRIQKNSGTYSETLETYGLTNLLDQILMRSNKKRNITISDKGNYYQIVSNEIITEEMLNNLTYFELFKYISKDNILLEGLSIENCYNYTYQKKIKKEKQEKKQEVYKKFNSAEQKKDRENALAEIEKYFTEVEKIDVEYDVYSQLIGHNQFNGFVKLFQNFHTNKDHFTDIIYDILDYYSQSKSERIKKLVKDKKLNDFSIEATSLQLYSPNQGKGLNKPKANGLNGKNFNLSWVSETMKIIGSLNSMICQLFKISGKSYDMKVFVPEFNQITNETRDILIKKFKNNLKGNTPITIDILNILNLILKFIENSPEFKGKIKNTIAGLHSVYQKNLGQNKAVVNIAFIQVPEFIDISENNKAEDWTDILKEQIYIIGSLGKEFGETGHILEGLKAYRNFINSGDLDNFFLFSFFYSDYLSKALTEGKFYIKPYNIETLNLFYKSMEKSDINLTEIIENIGFKAIAQAIRNSTVILHYHKDNRKFEPRYGVAQQLQNKSKSKTDLATYVGEFISNYNSETAKFKENHQDFKDRAIVKAEELNDFFKILDKSPSSRVIGALLASYGFALKKKDVKVTETPDDLENNNEE